VGAVSTILQLLKLPDGTVKVLVEGIRRGQVTGYVHTDPYFLAKVAFIEDGNLREEEAEVLIRALMSPI